MSTLSGELDSIASALQATPLPHSEMLMGNMYEELKADPASVRQQHITDAAQGFSTMVSAIMPTETLGRYIKEKCTKEPLQEMEMEDSRLVFIVGWDEDEKGVPILPDNPTMDERRSTGSMFSKAENMRSIQLLRADPNLLLAICTLQIMIGKFFDEIIERIPDDREGITEFVNAMKTHWVNAANFVRMFLTAIVTVTKEKPLTEVFRTLTQKDIEAAFQLLVESKAFEVKTTVTLRDAPETSGRDVKLFCPVQKQLREIMVDQECLMTMVEKIRDVKTVSECATLAIGYTRIEEIVENLDEVLRKGGMKEFLALQEGNTVFGRRSKDD